MLKCVLAGCLALFAAAVGAMGAEGTSSPAASDGAPGVRKNWEVDFESGILWRAGHNGTHLNYVLLPQILTLKTPPVIRHALAGGGELTIRSRFSLLVEPIVEGPENHFIGATASGLLEWWNPSRTFSLFFSSGGGVGGLDSKGYEFKDAQGQDLNFTWFLYPGARIRLSNSFNASFGVYYQHVSNTGLDKVNPGIDAIGPMLSLGWRF